MEAVQSVANKSTNVRPISQRRLRWGFAALDALSPHLASLAADRLFFTPRRFSRPDWEQQLMASARRFELRHGATRLPAYSWGEGPTVLLVHGWEGRGTQMGGFVPALLAHGLRAVAIDLPGHGGAADARTSVFGFAQALASALPQLGPLAGVIGHSAGAAATVLARTMVPYDARLVLLAPPRGPRTFFDQFVDFVGLSTSATRLFEKRMQRRFGRSIDSLDITSFGSSVPLPTLVIHDRDDKDVPYAHGQAVAAQLPNAILSTTRGLGHRRILRDAQVVEQSLAFLGVPGRVASASLAP